MKEKGKFKKQVHFSLQFLLNFPSNFPLHYFPSFPFKSPSSKQIKSERKIVVLWTVITYPCHKCIFFLHSPPEMNCPEALELGHLRNLNSYFQAFYIAINLIGQNTLPITQSVRNRSKNPKTNAWDDPILTMIRWSAPEGQVGSPNPNFFDFSIKKIIFCIQYLLFDPQ